MTWLLRSTDIPPIAVFWVMTGILLAGVVSYWLYRILLTPMVEHGESHPANVRRGMWVLFIGLSLLSGVLLLQSWLRPTAIGVLFTTWLIFALISLFTRKQA